MSFQESGIGDVSDTLSEKPSVQADFASPSPDLLIAFGGFSGELGMPVFEFANFTGRFDTKRLFVRDIRQGWYQFGLAGICDDIPGVTSFLQRVIREQEVRNVVVIGNSMGGFAALLFGCLIGAVQVHAFSPQTFIGPWRRTFAGDFRWRPQMRKIHRTPGIDRQYWDVRNVLRSSTNRTTQYHIHYCPGHYLDRAHAGRMSKCPGVTLHRYPEGGHGLVRHLRDTGILEKLLSETGLARAGS